MSRCSAKLPRRDELCLLRRAENLARARSSSSMLWQQKGAGGGVAAVAARGLGASEQEHRRRADVAGR